MNWIKKILHGIYWRLAWVARKSFRYAYKVGTQKIQYPLTYRREVKRQPFHEKKIVFLEIRMMELTDSFQRLYDALKEKQEYEVSVCYLGMGLQERRDQYRNSLAALREIAAAKYVFINDSSSLISCITLRPETKVIQTWHACGAFKKFGFSTAQKEFGGSYRNLLRFPLHKNFSYVTVSSPEVIWAYAEAFHMEEQRENIVATGISRTDVFYDEAAICAAQKKVRELLPADAQGKKKILYAPTYRGRVRAAHSPEEMDLDRMQKALGEEYVILCKHHPFVKQRPEIAPHLKTFAFDMTDAMSIEELLMVSDICISDYSSLIFEYSLFERPMIFFAYDLEEYFDFRGFYYPYEEMTPGPVCRTTEEMIDYIRNIDENFDRQQVAAFKEKFMSACDGHATERILALLS